MALPEIVPLRERDLPAAAAALSRAFHDDPLQMYVFPDPVERAARSPAGDNVSPFRHATFTIRNLTLAAPWIIDCSTMSVNSEKGNQTGTEGNIENTPIVRRIGAPICA